MKTLTKIIMGGVFTIIILFEIFYLHGSYVDKRATQLEQEKYDSILAEITQKYGESKSFHICILRERDAGLCPQLWGDVCGNNDVTYSSGCEACHKVEVDYWVKGKCNDSHVCTAGEKQAVMCTLQYDPVCGTSYDCGNQSGCGENNLACDCVTVMKTYGNGCGACSSGADSWVRGECN